MALATLSIDLEARMAKLEEGFTKATRTAEKAAADVEERWSKVGTFVGAALGGAVAAVSFGAIKQWLLDTANGLDALNDAADSTGSSVEKLSALEDIGNRTGASFDTVTAILIKFNAQLAEAKDSDSGAARALRAIGLEAAELRRLDPADALKKTADALAGYAQNGEKARLTQELFGKGVKEAASFLNDLAAAGQLNATATAKQTEEVDKFNKILFESRTNIQEISRNILSSFLPAFNNMIARMKEDGGYWESFWKDRKVGFFGDRARTISGELAAAVKELEKLDKKGETGPNASLLGKKRVAELRKEIAELQVEAAQASERVKTLLNGGKPVEAAPLPDATKAFLYGNAGYGDPPSVEVEPAIKKREAQIARLQAAFLKRPSVKSIGQDNELNRFVRDYQRAQEDGEKFAEQLSQQNKEIGISLITDDRARGQAQIELDRQIMADRIRVLQLGGSQQADLWEKLSANILARQAVLEEQLKPSYQRILEAWGDTTTNMARTFDDLMEGVILRTEDALTKFVRTGKLSVDDLANYVQDAIARMLAQQAIAQGTKFATDLFSLYSKGFAKGGAFGPSGQITAFANGGVVGSPTYFGYEGGKRKGLMGEAGPEAIMPLARGRDGKLGVRGGGGTAINVTMNVQSGVSRSEVAALVPMLTAQIKAELQGSMRRPGFAG